jgi:hypothetical protein
MLWKPYAHLAKTEVDRQTRLTADPNAQVCNNTLVRPIWHALSCAPSLALIQILLDCLSSFLMPLMYLGCSPFLLANFVKSTPLRNAVIMALPHHVGIGRESEEALDSLSVEGQVQLLLLEQQSTINDQRT